MLYRMSQRNNVNDNYKIKIRKYNNNLQIAITIKSISFKNRKRNDT